MAGMRNLTYKERLAALRLQSLQHRRLFNDLLLAFKSLHSFTVQPASLGLNVRNITMTYIQTALMAVQASIPWTAASPQWSFSSPTLRAPTLLLE